MSYCTSCGGQLAGDEVFCPACGAKLESSPPPRPRPDSSEGPTLPGRTDEQQTEQIVYGPVEWQHAPPVQPPTQPRGLSSRALLWIAIAVAVLAIAGAAVGIVVTRHHTSHAKAATVPSASASTSAASPSSSSSPTATATFTDSLADVSRAAYVQQCRPISFRVLDKDADVLRGDHYRLTGQVFQIQDAGQGKVWQGFRDGIQPETQMLVAVTNEGYGVWGDNVQVVYAGRLASIYEKDLVTVWGVCVGHNTYTSQAGYQITVPLIEARYVSKGSVHSPTHSAAPSAAQADASCRSTLNTYFSAINAGDFQTAWDQFSPTLQGQISVAHLQSADATTHDTNLVIHYVSVLGSRTAVAYVTFTSTQAASFGPNGDTRDDWTLDYTMTLVGSRWLMDAVSGHNGSTHTTA